VRLWIIALLVVLGGIAVVSGSAAMPQGLSRLAPPPTPRPDELSFELTDSTLTQRLQPLVGQPLGDTPLGRATLISLSTQIKPNQLVANGEARVGDRTVPVSFAGHVDVQSGRPLVVVSDARAAGIPLPDATREALRRVVQDQVDQEIGRLNMRVTSVTLTDGKLLVIGRRS
jgi:hypothetical protein